MDNNTQISSQPSKKTMKPNTWLITESFLEKSNFPSKYYIKNLGQELYNYIITVPVPVITSYDPVHYRIYFSIGNGGFYLPLNQHIAYEDFVTLVSYKMEYYFPGYDVIINKNFPLTNNEIEELMKKDPSISIGEAMKVTKPIGVKVKGKIKKMFVKGEKFILEENGKSYMRACGNDQTIITSRDFLKGLRNCSNGLEIYEYIQNSSFLLEELAIEKKKKVIAFKDEEMLKQFFIINFPNLKQDQLIEVSPLTWAWGNYNIEFPNKEIENECYTYYKNQILAS